MVLRSRHLKLVLAAAVAVLLLAGGCSGDGDPAPAAPPTTTRPTTTQSQEDRDEAELEELSKEWFEAIRRIFIDGQNPDIAEQYVTGDYLDGFRQQVAEYESQDRRTERDPQDRTASSVEIIEIDGDTADVTECLVNGDILLQDESDEIVDDGVTARRTRTSARRTDGGWRFTARIVLEEHPGETSCPEP